jgi:serine/threonine protein kinase
MSWYFTQKLHFPEHFSPVRILYSVFACSAGFMTLVKNVPQLSPLQELRSLLTGMLDKSPAARITLQQIKEHAWFSGFSWEALEHQTMTAPKYPEMQSAHIHSKLAKMIDADRLQ